MTPSRSLSCAPRGSTDCPAPTTGIRTRFLASSTPTSRVPKGTTASKPSASALCATSPTKGATDSAFTSELDLRKKVAATVAKPISVPCDAHLRTACRRRSPSSGGYSPMTTMIFISSHPHIFLTALKCSHNDQAVQIDDLAVRLNNNRTKVHLSNLFEFVFLSLL